jgi:predicted acyltransferase
LPQNDRLVSLDAFRGLTMLLMLFVNDIGDIDLGHIQDVPWWLKHMPTEVDGMTMADVIFPCFLFIVGMAIPIALEQRIARGDSFLKLGMHIVLRAAALVFIGVCMVNSCHGIALDETAMGMSGAWWRVLMFLGVMMFWNRWPAKQGAMRWLFVAVRVFAAALLIYLLAIFRADQGGVSVWLQPRWWGIIGLIGWAYLVSAFIWLACRNHGTAIMGVFALLIALNIGLRSGLLSWWGGLVGAMHGWLPALEFGAYASMATAGMAIATLFRPNSPATTPWSRIVWTLLFGGGFAAAGFLLRPLGGLHSSAPSWVLCSMAVACAAYALLYWLVDVKEITRWTAPIAPAGSNTLLMYMLPYVFYSMLTVLGIDYLQTHLSEGWTGVARSAVVAICLLGVTGVLTRCGIRLKV